MKNNNKILSFYPTQLNCLKMLFIYYQQLIFHFSAYSIHLIRIRIILPYYIVFEKQCDLLLLPRY